jgi:hypothetical protein
LNPLSSVEANRVVIRLEKHKAVWFVGWRVLKILVLARVTIGWELGGFELEDNDCVEEFVATTWGCELDAEMDEKELARGSVTRKNSLNGSI